MEAADSRSFVWVKRIFLAIAALFVIRLIFLQVLVSGEYQANASEVRTIQFDTAPHRGTIYDRNGVVLAVSVEATTIYCNPGEVTDLGYESSMLARVLGGDASDIAKKMSDKTTTFSYIARQADVDMADQVKALNLDGIYFIQESRREYPNGSIGGQVIGACDVDGNGICGLELQYDDILRGTPGTYSAERGLDGTPIPGGVHEDVTAIDGEDIMVSLDIKLQDSVEKALEAGLERNDPKKGSAVVMDGETGECYAICSYPYLDPSDLENSLIGSDNLIPVTSAYEPGSVFKAFSALAVLDEDALKPSDVLFVPKELQADEYVITDAHEREDQQMSFAEILDKSSNVGISLSVDKVGFQKLYDTIKQLKLDQQTGIDFPGEVRGKLDDVVTWSTVGGYNISFGQGISVTPIQIVRAYGAFVNDGVMVTPHLLISKPQSGDWIEYPTEKVIDNDKALADLTQMLRGVVTDGTGKKANIDGFEVVGKTSTAEISKDGTYTKDSYNLCFTGFIANSTSKLVCFVGANEVPYEGNISSIFHDIMIDAIDLYRIVPR